MRRFLLLLLLLSGTVCFAQTIKTDVLVIGGNASGVAAAVQCARSKVKTILAEQGNSLCPELKGNTTITITADHNLPAGIWGEFCKQVRAKETGIDTAWNAPLKLVPDTGAAILTRLADTAKNLTVELNSTFTSITKDGDRWEVQLNSNGNRETIKARVIIDATTNGDVLKKVNATIDAFDPYKNTDGLNEYRTAIATGDGLPGASSAQNNYPPYPQYFIPLRAMVAHGAENVLVARQIITGNINYLPAQLSLGQGAGVTAAYCAFFKTTTANLNVRLIQGELLDFKGYLLPLADVVRDPFWRPIQQICATGLLKGLQKQVNGEIRFVFNPDSIVRTAEIKPVMLETYTRAFIWFNKEKPGEQFTIGNLLSFISELTLTDPDNLYKNISTAWTAQFHFTTGFDTDRPITRREFAILANKYLNPFARTIDLSGRIVN